MRGLFLRRGFLLGTGAGGVVGAAALATGQRLAFLLRGTGDNGGDFSVDCVALIAEFTELLCVQWLSPFQ
jgi:hypothetical protein